uniref:Uncharacterized protein n=1 Tax=Gallus gallus TaxID=9031 RepID=Q5F3D0_CHICK|nr:hypothetical protein RCJMB04_21c11 [Gallus gallus]
MGYFIEENGFELT